MSAQLATARPASGRILPRLWQAVPWALVAILTVLNLLHAARLGPNDDAFITYRVARNLATGLGPVFNPGERVLSITTPGYMLLLSASSVFSQDFVGLAMLWNGVGLLAAGALLIDASRAGPAGRSPGLTALTATVAVALTLSNPLLSAAVGMETPLYLAALLGVFAAYRRAWQQRDSRAGQRWLLLTAALAALAFLLRPDGILAGLVVGAHWLATQRRMPWPALALALALALPWVLFAWAYYGSPLPNTLAAKVTLGLPDRAEQWGRQLWEIARAWAGVHAVAALLAAVGLAAAVRRSPASAGQQSRRLLLAWAALYVLLHTLLRARGYFWYYVPLLPVAALLAGDGLAAVTRRLLPWPATRNSRQVSRAAAALAVAVLLAAALYPALTATRRLAAVDWPGQRDVAYQQTGLLLKALCQQPGFEPVGMAEIGILGYVSDCHILDFSGLLQPPVAHLRLPAADKMAWAIKSYAPPLVVLAGSTGFPHTVAGQLWFRQRYEPYDIQDEEGFLSVIYRRAMGPPAQRDLATAQWWRSDPAAGQPLTATLVFPPEETPAITLHAFLPAGSGLAVAANGEPLLALDGAAPSWQDLPAAGLHATEGQATLELAGHAADQPAAVAWIESNAIPAVHYFAPFEEAAAQPRPSLRLDLGEQASAVLAPAGAGRPVLDVGYRDRPGVRLAVLVDGQTVDVVGGASDGWQAARIPLPAGALSAQPSVRVELRNLAEQFVRVYYVALVDPARPPYVP